MDFPRVRFLSQEDYVFDSVGLFVCLQHCSQRYEWIVMKLYGGVRGGKRNK